MASFGLPLSTCREARFLAAVPLAGLAGALDCVWMAVVSVLGKAEAASPGPLFALGSETGSSGPAGDRLRLRCFGGNLPIRRGA